MKLRNIFILGGVLFAGYSLYGQDIKGELPTFTHDVRGAVQAKIPAVDYKLTDNSITVPNLLKETNKQRTNAGLPELTLDTRLNTSASNKCKHHAERDYWAHDDPNSSVTWESFLIEITYVSAGENHARGYYTAKQVMTGWMGSPEHRANLLNPNFDAVGFGVCDAPSSKRLVVQHFADI